MGVEGLGLVPERKHDGQFRLAGRGIAGTTWGRSGKEAGLGALVEKTRRRADGRRVISIGGSSIEIHNKTKLFTAATYMHYNVR